MSENLHVSAYAILIIVAVVCCFAWLGVFKSNDIEPKADECYIGIWDNSTRPMRGVEFPVANCTKLHVQCDYMNPDNPSCRNRWETGCYDDFMVALDCMWMNSTIQQGVPYCECIIK